jgi:DNA-directed RNA polymerase specialized sigma24 family protein
MRNPDHFDEFYKTTRDRLLLQTFALTGDLRASRSAVRDAYVIAWHHWRKVTRQPDGEVWVRVHAWTDARARHNAKIFHRDRAIDSVSRATLDALAKLNIQQRRILVLTQLTSRAMPDIAREVGLHVADAERLLQTATATYAVQRGSASSQIRAELMALSAVTDAARLPRSSIVRRAGAARRRGFTAAGLAGSVVVLLGAGSFVTEVSRPAASTDRPADPGITLQASELLGDGQVAELAAGDWTATPGAANTSGTGLNTPCQAARFADPDGLGSLVRRFQLAPTKAQPATSVVQSTELSRTVRGADTTYDTTLGWYAGCVTSGVHLVDAFEVSGVGDRADVLVLERTAARTTSTYTVGVARTGQVTTTVFHAQSGAAKPVKPIASLLAAAVSRLCGAPGAGRCAYTPVSRRIPPPAVGDAPGMLDVVDLTSPGKIVQPWTATEPHQARVNLATVACEGANFAKPPVSGGRTRSYLILKAGLATRFGITETVGTLPDAAEAAAFVDGVRKRMAKCEDNFAASKVTGLVDRTGAGTQLAAWQITTEVSDEGAVDMLMAIVRRGPQVAQIGFVTARNASYDRSTFLALAERATERLAYLAAPKNS